MAGSAVVSAVPSICSIIIRLDTISAISLLRRGERGGMSAPGAGRSVWAVVKGGIIMHDSKGYGTVCAIVALWVHATEQRYYGV
ncbi:hypothetical protein AA15973_1991 [Komagataeibacter sucrofermentans DSM 15973]|nr:hypothetical protein AA15973_1991 [Komagataeibacter sucrofermentans DSM 15973]